MNAYPSRNLAVVGISLIILIGHAGLACAAPTEGEFVLRVRGFVAGVGFAARREALKEAQREAIHEILRSKISSDDLRPFRSMIRKADRYVTRIVELHLDTHGDQTQVEADAYLDMTALEQDLATLALPRLPEPPTVSCLIAVETDGVVEVESPGVAEEALMKGLKNLGLAPAPHTELPKLFKTSDFHEAVLGDVSVVAAYARETLADVVVIGLVVITREPPREEGAAARTRGTLSLKILRGHDGDLLDALSRSAAIIGVDAAACREEVLRDVAAKVLGDITVASVLSVLSMQKQDQVLITLHNPGDRDRLATFTDVLQNEPQIDSIEVAFFSEELTRIRLGYIGSMGYLADLIRDREYLGWPLEIQRVVGRDMTLLLVPTE